MNRTIILFLTLVAGLSLTQGCSSKDNADMGPGSIAGTVTYRERMMIPPDAVATVTLEDVARADAKAELFARSANALSAAGATGFGGVGGSGDRVD